MKTRTTSSPSKSSARKNSERSAGEHRFPRHALADPHNRAVPGNRFPCLTLYAETVAGLMGEP
jgi:hypothetical protein